MRLSIHNTSRYPKAVVETLVRFAAQSVTKVDGRLINGAAVGVRVTNYGRAFRGRAFVNWQRREILCRVGAPERFPIKHTYWKFNDMPEVEFRDWQECLVGVAAHELYHLHRAPTGRKDDEMICELALIDAVEEFRKDRQGIEAEMLERTRAAEAREIERHQKRDSRITERRSPAWKLEQAREYERRWTRRLKLAQTKVRAARKRRQYYERKTAEAEDAMGTSTESVAAKEVMA